MTTWRHVVASPDGPVALVVHKSTDTVTTTRFWHRDHLGSIVAISDIAGNLKQAFKYDPWGGRTVAFTANGEEVEERGYTGHETLAEIGLVHMNGRLYDPHIGRFLSADPIIQDMYQSQSLNRYAYVMNNPMSYTDPSGFSFWTKWRRAILAIAVAWIIGPSAYSLTALMGGGTAGLLGSGFASAVAAGFAAGGIQTGSLRGAILGAISAAMFYGVGTLFENHSGPAAAAGKVAAHAAVGCATSVLAGGSCGSGAASAGFAEAAGNIPGMPKGFLGGLISRAIIGGIASKLGGGKFENGAMTAAFGYLFNCLSHRGTCGQSDRPEIAEGYAACRSRTCEDEYRQYASEAGVKIPISMGASIKDFFDLTSFPARVFNPIGRNFDMLYGAAEAAYDKFHADSADWKGFAISTAGNVILDRVADRANVGFNWIKSVFALDSKANEAIINKCVGDPKCQ